MQTVRTTRPPVAYSTLDPVLAGLAVARRRWRNRHHGDFDAGVDGFPSRGGIEAAMTDLKAALYPQRLGDAHGEGDEAEYVAEVLTRGLHALKTQVRRELRYRADPDIDESTDRIVTAFAAALPKTRELIDGDVEAAFRSDPAAGSVDEILICYPGTYALIHHRLAHQLYRLGAPLVARIIAERAHSRTGVDIHPGATIGPNFFIDHGTGVVIGETAIIGARVRLYQAVTLGARKLPTLTTDAARSSPPRHPIIEDDVTIYAGATILGRVTIGRGSVIGGNVWLVEDVPADSLVSQGEVSLRVLARDAGR